MNLAIGRSLICTGAGFVVFRESLCEFGSVVAFEWCLSLFGLVGCWIARIYGAK